MSIRVASCGCIHRPDGSRVVWCVKHAEKPEALQPPPDTSWLRTEPVPGASYPTWLILPAAAPIMALILWVWWTS